MTGCDVVSCTLEFCLDHDIKAFSVLRKVNYNFLFRQEH